jgi:rhodanese-related sulfurtransferase
MFLDARSTVDYEAGHVANSLSLPFERFAEVFPAVGAMLPHDVPIIIYCDGEQCELSHQLLGRLRSNGYQNLRVLVNGWTVWRDAGLPTVTGPHP